MSGILFLTASLNGETMQNVVNILFNKTVIKEYNLPQVNKITFFKLPELKKIEFENGEMTVENGIQRVVDSLDNSEIEKRTLTINDSASQIPGIIMDAMKEVGKSNIILDLTSGRKDITGSMYTAASISQIANMVYMEVFKDENEEFLELSYKDEEILPKFSIKIFKSLGEIENLASMNYIDFVIYKKTIEEMGASFDEVDKDYFESYKIQLNNAVNSYFSVAADGYLNCAKSIGVLNENFIGKLLDYLKKNLQSIYPDDLVSGKIPVSFIDKIEKDYNKLSTKKELSAEEQDKLKLLSPIFGSLPALYEFLITIKRYRNVGSHEFDNLNIRKDEAKLLLEIMLTIFIRLEDVGILNDVLKSEN